MDRLVCGDVGYGKTEVALRAASSCGGRQAGAVLVPTTILAEQHFQTFEKRLKISGAVEERPVPQAGEQRRFRRAAPARWTWWWARTAAAEDVLFKDLGLVTIDEEHRFGVPTRNAEAVRTQVEVLTPERHAQSPDPAHGPDRIRDFRPNETAPGRLAVKTYLLKYDK
jgi:transcription-repair coupling factor (superfamily II helicase)